MKTWKDRVRNVYESLEELIAYDEVYNIASRCDYESPHDLWRDNPLIGGSTNPADLGIVTRNRLYAVTGTCRRQYDPLVVFNESIYAHSPRQAMDRVRKTLYEAGLHSILVKTISHRVKGQWRQIKMEVAIGIE